MGFKPKQPKPSGSGIQKGQKQQRTVIRKKVTEILAEAGVHPVTELMKLIPQLTPKDAARVWSDLLQYVEPKLSAQAITVDDRREQTDEVIDVTPVTTDELLKTAQGDGE